MIQSPLVFRINPKRNRKWEIALVALVFVAPLAMIVSFLFQWEMMGMLFSNPAIVVILISMPVTLLLATWFDRRFASTAKLMVDAEGLQMQSGLPAILGSRNIGSWKCSWADVRSVTVMERFGLVRIARKGFFIAPIGLRIADWVEDTPNAEALARPVPANMIRSTSLWKALENAGLFNLQIRDPAVEALEFDLAKHPRTKMALVIMGALFAYGAVDPIIGREAWAEWSPKYVVPHVLLALIAIFLAWIYLRVAREPKPVPANITVVLAVLLGFSAGIASWSGLIRVNQLVAGPLVEKAYFRNQFCDALIPEEAELPSIEYTGLAEDYWCSFPADHRHVVPVRKGLGGLYQVDLTRHTEAIREFRGSR